MLRGVLVTSSLVDTNESKGICGVKLFPLIRWPNGRFVHVNALKFRDKKSGGIFVGLLRKFGWCVFLRRLPTFSFLPTLIEKKKKNCGDSCCIGIWCAVHRLTQRVPSTVRFRCKYLTVVVDVADVGPGNEREERGRPRIFTISVSFFCGGRIE